MKKKLTPTGFTLIQLVVVILLLGVGGLAAFKIGMPYFEANIVKSIIARTLAETVKDTNPSSEYDIAKKIFDRIIVQGSGVSFDKIIVKRKNNEDFTVHIDLITSITLWKNARLLVELEANGTTEGMSPN